MSSADYNALLSEGKPHQNQLSKSSRKIFNKYLTDPEDNLMGLWNAKLNEKYRDNAHYITVSGRCRFPGCNVKYRIRRKEVSLVWCANNMLK